MALIAELLHLLRRPLASAASFEPAPSRRTKGAPAEPAPSLPVTEAELIAALDRVAEERRAAEDAIAAAAERRETLLLTADDAAIFQADRDADGANLLLERLDRLEPDLRTRLATLRAEKRVARWVELSGDYIAAGRAHHVLAEQLEAQRPVWEAARDAVLAEFPEARDWWPSHAASGSAPLHVLPPFPLPPPGAVARFPEELDKLARTMPADAQHRPQPLLRSLADLVQQAHETGTIPDAGGLQPDLERLLAGQAKVRFLGFVRDGSGTMRQPDEIVMLSGADARAEVQAGRAEYLEDV